jgi:hypothetical protein
VRSQDRWRNVDRGERGSATLEFVVAAVVLIVPVALFSAVMSQVFSVAMAAQNVARNGVHAFALAVSDARGRAVVHETAELTFADFGIDTISPRVAISCSSTPCHQPESFVTVTISADVPVIGLPLVGLTSIPITAQSTERISRLWDIDAPR